MLQRTTSLDLALASWLVSFQCSVIPLGRKPATSFVSKQGTGHTSDKAKEDKGQRTNSQGFKLNATENTG